MRKILLPLLITPFLVLLLVFISILASPKTVSAAFNTNVPPYWTCTGAVNGPNSLLCTFYLDYIHQGPTTFGTLIINVSNMNFGDASFMVGCDRVGYALVAAYNDGTGHGTATFGTTGCLPGDLFKVSSNGYPFETYSFSMTINPTPFTPGPFKTGVSKHKPAVTTGFIDILGSGGVLLTELKLQMQYSWNGSKTALTSCQVYPNPPGQPTWYTNPADPQGGGWSIKSGPTLTTSVDPNHQVCTAEAIITFTNTAFGGISNYTDVYLEVYHDGSWACWLANVPQYYDPTWIVAQDCAGTN